VYGSRFRYETISDIRFRISAHSFFQINAVQAEKLSSLVTGLLDVGEKDVVVDGYGGVGLFSLTAAERNTVVHLYDTSRSAVKDSGFNAANRGLSSFHAIKADMQTALEKIGRADKLILDPPRQGLGPKAVEAACGFGARTVVYVSCNPATLARDLKSFISAGYIVERVIPVDMFPHTYHIETVVKLTKE
jgi:23S rRNA (uracil1939-C5)-methyltransferase